MPHETTPIALPNHLVDAVDATVGSEQRQHFVHEAVTRALSERALRDGDLGIEPWWPLQGLDFLLLSSGEYWLGAEEEE